MMFRAWRHWCRQNIITVATSGGPSIVANGQLSAHFMTGNVTAINETQSQPAEQLPFTAIPTPAKCEFDSNTPDAMAKLIQYVDKCHNAHGAIFKKDIGPVEVVFISSPDLVRQTYANEGKCPRHPCPEAWLLYNQVHGCKRGLFFMDGNEWTTHRLLFNNLLLRNNCLWSQKFVADSVRRFVHTLTERCARSSAEKWHDIVELERQLYAFTTEATVRVFLGNAYNHRTAIQLIKPIIDALAQHVHRIFLTSAQLTMPAALARNLNLKEWTNFEESVSLALNLSNELLDCALDRLRLEDGLLLQCQQMNIERAMLKRIFADLLIAGIDTSTFAIMWTLYLLAGNQNVQQNLREIVLADPANAYDSALTKATIRETLRLYPVAPFIGRFMPADVTLAGYRIPQNTLVVMSLVTSGRDEKNFVQAHTFSPYRWIRNDNQELPNVLHPFASLPFAKGLRSCVGKRIAMIEIGMLVTELVRHFEMEVRNERPIEPILRMLTVPSDDIRIAIRPLRNGVNK